LSAIKPQGQGARLLLLLFSHLYAVATWVTFSSSSHSFVSSYDYELVRTESNNFFGFQHSGITTILKVNILWNDTLSCEMAFQIQPTLTNGAFDVQPSTIKAVRNAN
jgi:hypothetical protein